MIPPISICWGHLVIALPVIILAFVGALPVTAAILPVGQGSPFRSPCEAVQAARPGDTIEVAGSMSWRGDVCVIRTRDLTIRSVGQGRARIEVSEDTPLGAGQAIWTVQAPGVVIEGVEFRGAAAGTAIRVAGGAGVTIRHVLIQGNKTGLETGDGDGTVTIGASEFRNNGNNLDVGRISRFDLTGSYSHRSLNGSLVRSRAAENRILYNRLTQEEGRSAFVLDLTEAGPSTVMGNLIQQAEQPIDPIIFAAGDQLLRVESNTFVNAHDSGTFIHSTAAPAVIRNNIFAGPGTISNHPASSMAGNFTGDPGFAAGDSFDYRLTPVSPAVGAGVESGGPMPAFQYVHPLCLETRSTRGTPDAGAWEFGGGGREPCDSAVFGSVETAVKAQEGAAFRAAARMPAAATASLQLSSGTASAGGSATLALHLSGGAQPSALQWTVTFSAAQISAIQMTAGPATTAAAKSLSCNATSGAVTCVVVGLNATPMADGVVAQAVVQLTAGAAGAVALQVVNPVAVTPGGQRIPAAATGGSVAVQQAVAPPPAVAGLRYVPLHPCRLLETRPEYNVEGRSGAFGPPYFQDGEIRTLVPSESPLCAIPWHAKALILNVTVVPRGGVDSVTVWPAGQARPQFRTVSAPDGAIAANSAIVALGAGGAIGVFASNATDLILDVSGYFTDQAQVSNLVYYPLPPCRVLDTRAQYRSPAGPFGPPTLQAHETRRVQIPATPYCQIPQGAAAYSLTLTVVPHETLAFLTAWPAGSARPNVSTINSPDGRVVANSVVVPAGQNGAIDLFAHDSTDVLIDITGYFAPDDGQNGLYYYPVSQCRAADTISFPHGGAFGGPMFGAETTRTVPVPSAPGCSGISAGARGYALNVTALPSGSPMPFLTVWPAGQLQPVASMLNAMNGQTVSNAAIVPAGAGGAVNIFTHQPTHIFLEIAGYFGR